jgi:glycosyltransferase involved in cell wall biosynthesis
MDKKKRIIVSVISDLVTDQRIYKVCHSLHNGGYDVHVIGTKRKNSKALGDTQYSQQRIQMFFQKGFLFYAEWNVRLWILLFFKRVDILVANDLDTLLPNYLHSFWRSKKLVYDSHEYFTQQAELQNRRWVKKIWILLEQWLFPKLKNVYTVNASIAKIYATTYGVAVSVIRNVPIGQPLPNSPQVSGTKKVIIVQGTGLNHDRGLEELVQAMQILPNDFLLQIIGSGLVLEKLKRMTSDLDLQSKIVFIPPITKAELDVQTRLAFCGVSLDKPTCLNHEYALPNKIFDYLHASIPMIVSNTTEVAAIVKKEKVGIVVETVSPDIIANAILELANNEAAYKVMKANCTAASRAYNWTMEEIELLKIFDSLK